MGLMRFIKCSLFIEICIMPCLSFQVEELRAHDTLRYCLRRFIYCDNDRSCSVYILTYRIKKNLSLIQ